MVALKPAPFGPGCALGFSRCGICVFTTQLGSIPLKDKHFRACTFLYILGGGFCDWDLGKYIRHHLVGSESGSAFQVEKSLCREKQSKGSVLGDFVSFWCSPSLC